MIVLEAPYPSLATSIVLPDPNWGDTFANNVQLAEKLGLDGTMFTYVKKPGLTRLSYSWQLDIHKTYEIINFHSAYKDLRIKITDADGIMWDAKCVTNPLEVSEIQRGLMEVNLEFVGKEL